MSTYSVHFYGIDITEEFRSISKEMEELAAGSELKLGGPGVVESRDGLYFSFKNYISDLNLGSSHYDGNGPSAQMTYLGKDADYHRLGIMVTEEEAADVDAMLQSLPADLDAVLRKVFGGSIPKASFHVLEGWG